MSLHRDLAVKKQIGSSEGKSFHLCKYIILRSLLVRNTGPRFVYSPPCFYSAHDWPHTHSPQWRSDPERRGHTGGRVEWPSCRLQSTVTVLSRYLFNHLFVVQGERKRTLVLCMMPSGILLCNPLRCLFIS